MVQVNQIASCGDIGDAGQACRRPYADRQSLRIWIRIDRVTTGGTAVTQIEIGNETDGQLGASHGAGIGLRNTRTRLSACYAGRAALQTQATQTRFVATITIPDSP